MKLFLFSLISIASLSFFSITKKNNSVLIVDHKIQDTVKIELEKTSFTDMQVLFIKDSAIKTEVINDIMGRAYGELIQFIQENKLQPQRFMAWYYSKQQPWLMDVAIQTNSIPEKLKGRIQSRIQKGGEVIIAHVWGPYDKIGPAYIRIENWLKENNRKAKGSPFEVYINDPSYVKSPSEIKTDVYQQIE